MEQASSNEEVLKVLLVEDTRTDAILIERGLKKVMPEGSDVFRVETLSQALHQVGDKNFDVVLLDLTLSDTSGFNGLLSIQNMAPTLPVVILTAHQDEDMALKAVQHGAQDYLFKDKADGFSIKRAMRYAIERKRFEGVLIRRANYDPLTGLANRMLFESRLDVALARRARSGDGVGVFFLDLDHFKHVNDELGHAAGDALLKAVGDRLNQSVRSYDTVARFGGDEFAVIVDSIKTPDDCVAIAKKVIQQIAEPFRLEKKTAIIGISIGIATCLAEEKGSRKDLMQHADEAMYSAKLVQESNFKFYSAEVHAEAVARTGSNKR